ncbi:MAG: DUF559 domain-containing protein [Ignavibacteriaceae bacterium]|nr:DUF559 domain-containing protein [Ignavibacteriaceae bacterium]
MSCNTQRTIAAHPSELKSRVTKIVIETDGKFWHTDISGRKPERDVIRDKYLIYIGYKVLRFRGREIYHDPERCINRIKDEIARASLDNESADAGKSIISAL